MIFCEWCDEYPAAHQIGQDGLPMWLICYVCFQELKIMGGLNVDE